MTPDDLTQQTSRRRRPFAAALLLVVFGIGWASYSFFGPVSLGVSGRLIDERTGMPIKDAWVILALKGSGKRFGGNLWESRGGCMGDSAVVRTDSDGRFAYRAEISSAERNGSQEFWIFSYHPEYAAVGLSDPENNAAGDGEYLVAIYRDGGTPEARIPRYRYLAGAGDALILMRRSAESGWAELARLNRSDSPACLSVAGHGQLEFHRTRFDHAVKLQCGGETGNQREGARLPEIMGKFEFMLYEIDSVQKPLQPERNARDRSGRRKSYLQYQLLPGVSWYDATGADAKVETPEERQLFCVFYSQPLNVLLEKDFLP